MRTGESSLAAALAPLQLSHVSRPPGSLERLTILATLLTHKWLPQKSHRDVSMCVLHLHDKRCSLGIHESLVMIVTSFTLRSPCSWKLQCKMYVLQFYLNRFSVVLAQLRLTLRCRCIDASTSTPLTSLHLHLHTLTSADLPLHLTTPTHLHIYITSVHPHCRSFTSVLSFFLSTYLFSRLCAFTSSHAHIHRSTSPPPYIYTSVSHLHIHTVTPSHPPSLSLFLYIFSTVLGNYMSRSRANRRLVFPGSQPSSQHAVHIDHQESCSLASSSFVPMDDHGGALRQIDVLDALFQKQDELETGSHNLTKMH